MLLSILIPVYNYCCVRLVQDLHELAEKSGIAYEILVADDGSTDHVLRDKNRVVDALPHCTYFALPHNRGRAAVRNWLVQKACGESLLFVDSDAQVCSADFLSNYAPFWGRDVVVCGGIVHPEELPSEAVSLRYRYEKAMEPAFSASERSKHPYSHLRTFNFMLPRKVALDCPFDESITLYGYEDTLMGDAFLQKGIPVVHIDNPLLNTELEDNERFLAKTEESMTCLYQLRRKMRSQSRLLYHYARLHRFRLTALLAHLHPIFSPLMRRHLLGARPCVWVLQFYKLSHYCYISHKVRSEA